MHLCSLPLYLGFYSTVDHSVKYVATYNIRGQHGGTAHSVDATWVLGVILSSGYRLCTDLHVLTVSEWVCFRFLASKNMPVGGLGILNCP